MNKLQRRRDFNRRLRGLSVIITAMLALVTLIFMTGCSGEDSRTDIRVLCAGSLMVPLDGLERAFEARHPDIDVLTEGHGSIQVIRHVTELFEEADVMMVADHSLIPMMMYDKKMPETDVSYADWYIQFAANTLGIAYTPASRYAGEINADNWYEVLARPDVKVGLSDARLDACGYRALMLLSLSGTFYRDDSLFEAVLGAFNPPLEITSDRGVTTVHVPEIMHPESERIVLRGSSIRLLALLESGDIDYAFEYESVAAQHRLGFLRLPPDINMGSLEHSGSYGQVACRVDYQRFSSVQPEFCGQPIIYGVTIPNNAPHPEAAREYLEFLLGPEGQGIFRDAQHPMPPPVVDNPDRLPPELAAFIGGLDP